MSFERWLAKLLGQGEEDVQRLLQDDAALHFLMTWSLFESKCFAGFVKFQEIEAFSARMVDLEGFDVAAVSDNARYFHARYQDVALYRHLMHKQVSARMERILKQPFESLSPEDKLFISAMTAYRYRNNIFHGNKGLDSWLQFRPQIKRCTEVLQAFINHAEARLPTMDTSDAA